MVVDVELSALCIAAVTKHSSSSILGNFEQALNDFPMFEALPQSLRWKWLRNGLDVAPLDD